MVTSKRLNNPANPCDRIAGGGVLTLTIEPLADLRQTPEFGPWVRYRTESSNSSNNFRNGSLKPTRTSPPVSVCFSVRMMGLAGEV
jgi:hypothetical protein